MEYGERFNCLSHLLGLVLALAGGAWLLAGTAATHTTANMLGAAAFSIAAAVLYLASTLYHAARGPIKQYWEKLDHCAIYALIAGTVTPFALDADMDALGWTSFLLIWLLAMWGIVKELRSSHGARPPLWLYLGLGWIGVLAVLQQWRALSTTTWALLLAGAGAYTLGTYFYRHGSRLTHAHGIWHLFVLAGTTCHFFSIQSHLTGA